MAKNAAKNAEKARKLRAKIALQLKKGAGKGVEAACRFLAARIKETVSVPAPKKKIGNNIVATSPAIKGAPPRVVSGRMRQGVTHLMLSPIKGVVGVHARAPASYLYPEGFNYPKYHETGTILNTVRDKLGEGDHPFIKPTAEKYERELKVIVGKEARVEMKKGGW